MILSTISLEIDIRRIIAMNDNLYNSGYISKKTHDAIYNIQIKKLTSIGRCDIISDNEVLKTTSRSNIDES